MILLAVAPERSITKAWAGFNRNKAWISLVKAGDTQ